MESSSNDKDKLNENQKQNLDFTENDKKKDVKQLNKIGLGSKMNVNSNGDDNFDIVEVIRIADPKQTFFLDLRNANDFFKFHISDSCNMPWNSGDLEERMFELPPRKSFLSLISDDEEILLEANDLLLGSSYLISELILFHSKSSSSLSNSEIIKETNENQQKPLFSIFSNSKELQDKMEKKQKIESIKNDDNLLKKRNFNFIFNSSDSSRFWKANPFLEKHIDEIEKLLTKQKNMENSNENNYNRNSNNNDDNENYGNEKQKESQQQQQMEKVGKMKLKAIDIGCGSGRDVVRLASRGWNVFAVDNDPHLLEKVKTLATRNNCQNNIITCAVDMESKQQQQQNQNQKEEQSKIEITNWQNSILNGQKFHLVHVARYLYREMFDLLKKIIFPGGFIVCNFFFVNIFWYLLLLFCFFVFFFVKIIHLPLELKLSENQEEEDLYFKKMVLFSTKFFIRFLIFFFSKKKKQTNKKN
jgi:SAM-dependent methyltransferase